MILKYEGKGQVKKTNERKINVQLTYKECSWYEDSLIMLKIISYRGISTHQGVRY